MWSAKMAADKQLHPAAQLPWPFNCILMDQVIFCNGLFSLFGYSFEMLIFGFTFVLL